MDLGPKNCDSNSNWVSKFCFENHFFHIEQVKTGIFPCILGHLYAKKCSNLFTNICRHLPQKFYNLYWKIMVTHYDSESNYSIKKATLCYIINAVDVWRCLSKYFSTFLHLDGQVCKEVSPFWPVLCEKIDFQNRILRLTLNLSHIWWGLNLF